MKVDLFEMRGRDGIKKCAYQSFDNVLDISFKMSNYNTGEKLRGVFSGFFVKKILGGEGIKNAMRLSILHNKLLPVIKQYDIIHVCFVTSQLFSFFDALKASKKLIVTWWGSDILQNNKDFDFYKHEKLVKVADKITVHQREMKELFLSKFGRELESKVREMLVISDVAYLDKFVSVVPEKQFFIKRFKDKHNISNDKRIVVVGHSAHPFDMHLEIIKVISQLKNGIEDKICLVFPLTYGCDIEGYFDMIAKACEESGIQYIMFTKFMTNEEVLELRMASEVLMRLSLIDAFSLSMCETLCAGNVLITGTWLPYGKLRGNNVYYEEVYEIEDSGRRLELILDNYEEYSKRCQANPANIKEIFAKENNVDKLHKIYTELTA